jgi:hypothetical protein
MRRLTRPSVGCRCNHCRQPSARPLFFRNRVLQPLNGLQARVWIVSAEKFVEPRVTESVLFRELLLRKPTQHKKFFAIVAEFLNDIL